MTSIREDKGSREDTLILEIHCIKKQAKIRQKRKNERGKLVKMRKGLAVVVRGGDEVSLLNRDPRCINRILKKHFSINKNTNRRIS